MKLLHTVAQYLETVDKASHTASSISAQLTVTIKRRKLRKKKFGLNKY